MIRDGARSGSCMTHRMTQAAALLALLGVLAGGLLACGRYGPPQPYPPDIEASDEDDEDRQP